MHPGFLDTGGCLFRPRERPVGRAEPEFLNGIEGLDPGQLLLEGADEAFGDAVARRLGDEGRAGADARKRSSAWKSSLMYCEPWSCRRVGPAATPWS